MEDKKKILLVDDDLDLLEQNKLLLEEKGFEVITADNSKDGMLLFKKENPDAAVLDLIMEEHDSGFILSYRIKKEKNIPVIVLTSATYTTGYKFSAATAEEKEWIKCDAILNKPVNIEELVQKLEAKFSLGV